MSAKNDAQRVVLVALDMTCEELADLVRRTVGDDIVQIDEELRLSPDHELLRTVPSPLVRLTPLHRHTGSLPGPLTLKLHCITFVTQSAPKIFRGRHNVIAISVVVLAVVQLSRQIAYPLVLAAASSPSQLGSNIVHHTSIGAWLI